MADVNQKVMELVEAELKKNPDISNPELIEKAKSVDKDVGKLSARQFNARYPLQVKRTMKPGKGRKKKAAAGRKPRAKKGAGRKATTRKASTARRGRSAAVTGAAAGDRSRDRVRKLLLGLARDVANAQGKGDVVDVIAGIDRYVDKVVKAAS